MHFIDAHSGAPVAPGDAFRRITAIAGRSEEVLAITDRLDAAMFLSNDHAEAHDAADHLPLTDAGLELAAA